MGLTKIFLKIIVACAAVIGYTLVGGVDMKHHISVTVRVDGGIEHQFDQVLEGQALAISLVSQAAQAISNVTSGWHHDRGAGCHDRTKYPWPGVGHAVLRWWDSLVKRGPDFVMVKGSAGTYKKGQEFDIEPQ